VKSSLILSTQFTLTLDYFELFQGLRGADERNEKRELFAPLTKWFHWKEKTAKTNDNDSDHILLLFNQWAEDNKENNKHARNWLDAQQEVSSF